MFGRRFPSTLAILVLLLAVYAYFFREPGGRTAAFDAYAMRTFAWYVTPIGLAAAVLGWALLVRRLFWQDPAFFLTVTTYSVFFFYKMRIVPEHFWSTRRFLAFTLPGLMLGLGGLGARRRRATCAVATAAGRAPSPSPCSSRSRSVSGVRRFPSARTWNTRG